MEFFIAEVEPLSSPDVTPSWVAEQAAAIARANLRNVYGHEDLANPVAVNVRNYAHQVGGHCVLLEAVAGTPDGLPQGPHGLPALSFDAATAGPERELVGTAGVDMPTEDNLTLAYLWCDVPETLRRNGIGSALLDAADSLCARYGRTVQQNWATTRAPGPDAPVLIPESGVSSVARDEVAEFMLSHGFVLEQVERHSELALPADPAALDRLRREAEAKASGYRLVTYTGRTPDELVEPICRLLQHFSTQEPNAGLDREETNWTPERYRAQDERRLANGRTPIGTLALDTAGGAVAFTEFSLPGEPTPHVAFQEITIVDAAHRGRRLGLLVKLANLRALERTHPEVTAVHTWNAHENQHMLAINDALGFRERTAEGAWQRRLG